MLIPFLTAALIFALFSLPGWILAGRTKQPVWIYAAAGFSSQFAVILCSSLFSFLLPGQVDSRFTLAIAVAMAGLAVAIRRRSPPSVLGQSPAPGIGADPWAFAVPIIATAMAALITHMAIALSDNGLVVRAWYNADGFKHLGHVNAIAAFGLPARDIFADGSELAYYWLFYVVPGTGAALHGNAPAALIASGLFQTFAFWLLVHGLLRMAGTSGFHAAMLALIAWLSPSLDGISALVISHGDVTAASTRFNIEGLNGQLLNGYTLFRTSLYIPQHQFMLAGLLSWGIFWISPRTIQMHGMRLLSCVPLICAGAVSTLLGVACLATFGGTQMLDGRKSLIARFSLIALIGIAALVLPIFLGIIDIRDATTGSGLTSPIFNISPYRVGPLDRLLLALPGLVAIYGVTLIGVVGFAAGWPPSALPEERKRTLIFAFMLTFVGIALLLALTLTDNRRLAQEMQLRVSLLAFTGLTVASAFLFPDDARRHPALSPITSLSAILLLLAGLATPVLDTIWHHASDRKWVVSVPADDMAILNRIRSGTDSRQVVLQYPELPFVAHGRDVWVPIIAGRTIYTSPRATHWEDQQERIAQTQAFFGGGGPLPSGRYEYVYLSRALHPTSYETLLEHMAAEKEWRLDMARPGASLWRRVPAGTSQRPSADKP